MMNKIDKARHSLSHIMATAIQNLYGNVSLGIGPIIENGFYYDIDFGKKEISKKDLPKIEREMHKIISQNLDFKKEMVSSAQAKKIFKSNKYKLELIKDLKKISIYRTGKFIDLCRGPHINNTKELRNVAFKLNKLAGAYWRGSEKNPMLTRIYGIAFTSKKELKDYLHMLQEAQKRDHRKLGAELEIFRFDDIIGKGLPQWLPKGTIIKETIENFAKEMEDRYGYKRVSTSHLGKEELYKTSGHLPYYKDSMYPPMKMDDGIYYLKAMNCPHHHLIYKSKIRSYRDLPVRLAEYGTCYRNELSGTLAGLLRVRSLQMNDAHIYCREDQVKLEVRNVIKLIQEYFKIFGFKDYWFRLSKGDPKNKDKYVNDPKNWKATEKILRTLLKEMKVKFIEAKDEASFYGPKIDIQLTSVIGREETMSTIQLDFVAKKKFNLKYTDKNGRDNNEVFVIHRAPLSTHERFMAFLIEHYAGAFPLWLAPEQMRIIPVGAGHRKAVKALSAELSKLTSVLKWPLRISIDDTDDTVGYKIRAAAKQKIPYTIVIGDKEIPNSARWSGKTQLTIRRFGKLSTKQINIKLFSENLIKEINNKR